MKPFKKAVLFLLYFFLFQCQHPAVFAEDEENKEKIGEITTDSELAEAESKLKEDPVNRDKEILKMPIETPASVTGENLMAAERWSIYNDWFESFLYSSNNWIIRSITLSFTWIRQKEMSLPIRNKWRRAFIE